jgi:hypothetical protein
MIKTAPRLWQRGLIVAFVLSCFGVLLYLTCGSRECRSERS